MRQEVAGNRLTTAFLFRANSGFYNQHAASSNHFTEITTS